jgi:hypothetical protein
MGKLYSLRPNQVKCLLDQTQPINKLKIIICMMLQAQGRLDPSGIGNQKTIANRQ